MATIIIFACSLFIASVLVLIKAIELKRGVKNTILKFIGRFDAKSHQLVSAVKFKSLQLIQSIRYIILVEAKRVAEDLLHKTKEKALNEYRIRQNMMMGQKEIVSRGSVSFYLKKITEHKGGGVKGKIEESL
jgi:hypothetical protein